jgi:alginate O-acetyltransferase complex protein AlgI
MLFNSFEFIFGFLPASLLIFYAIGSLDRKLATLWLAVCSIFFYACWNYRMTALLLASVAFNYLCAFLIHRCSENRYLQNAILTFGILVDLGVLIFYKYLSALIFFLEENGVVTAGTKFEIILPLGISFFTFTQIGFLIDVRQRVAKYRGPVSYVAFVTFFPHLIAGPILHNREILPQFEDPRMGRFSAENIALGLSYFAIGLMKKILIADNLAGIADNGFAHPHTLDLFGAWGVTLAYTFQLYFDFSGYSDMAIALARMFGIIFPANFNSPYKATSIIDFWQRWHMTLTRYLMLYVYNPLAIRVARRRAARYPMAQAGPESSAGFTQLVVFPTMVAMGLAGVWHGAGLQFLIFGVMHGSFLCINHAWRIFGPRRRKKGAVKDVGENPIVIGLKFVLTFLAVLAGWILFRAASLSDAVAVINAMVGGNGLRLPELPQSLPAVWRASWLPLELAALFLALWLLPNTQELFAKYHPILGKVRPAWAVVCWRPNWAWAFVTIVLWVAAIMALTAPTRFLYFQF